jgi:hypothetical protein
MTDLPEVPSFMDSALSLFAARPDRAPDVAWDNGKLREKKIIVN